MQRESFIDPAKLSELNDKVYNNAAVDREHLMELLTLIDTNDAETIITEVKNWLKALHDNPKFDKIRFNDGEAEAVIGDLDSYGRVQPETIMQYKQNSNKTLPIS